MLLRPWQLSALTTEGAAVRELPPRGEEDTLDSILAEVLASATPRETPRVPPERSRGNNYAVYWY